MSKRTSGTAPRTWWPTPLAAIQPLLAVLDPGTAFIEPCAGDGALMYALIDAGHPCVEARDIAPLDLAVDVGDALDLAPRPAVTVITNPPFERKLLVPLLCHWHRRQPAWLLLPSDALINLWFAPFAPYVNEIVPIGRISWLNNGVAGKDNNAWVRFGLHPRTFLHARKAKP